MFIQVKLLHGSQRSLWYKTTQNIARGTMVQVPVRNTITPALVIQANEHPPKTAFDIKQIGRVEPFPNDPHYMPFLQNLGNYYQIKPLHFIKRIRSFLKQKKKPAQEPELTKHAKQVRMLTDEQQRAAKTIINALHADMFKPFVLQGLTGSGKTEVYKAAFEQCIAQNKSALLLLPEVTLALALQQRIQQELPMLPLFGFHSACTNAQKQQLWHRLVAHQPTVIVGVHLPVLMPIARLGLIVVDEEHEVGYQEKKHPKINSKEAALLRAQCAKIPIVLGSATPAMQTLYNIDHKGWERLSLSKRFGGTLPTIQTVLLSKKKNQKRRPHFWISNELYHAIQERLTKKEQAIIFINRRGYSFFVQCKQCSYLFACKQCSVSLTLHEDNVLRCHYCHQHQPLNDHCPECKASQENLLKRGIGTQQVVAILHHLFPSARIARADLDTTSQKKQWHNTIEGINKGSIDILVGTQTVTKGFHFPRVTLVGILWADLNLNFPMYNATETTLQQLIQVAGRAGRASVQSTVIVQSMAEHPVFNYVSEEQYPDFYLHEIKMRAEVGYPPCKRLVEIELKHSNETTIEREAHDFVGLLQMHKQQLNVSVTILGPARPPVHKVQNIFTRTIYLKAQSMRELILLYQAVNKAQFSSKLFFTPNPVT